jgi:hypothetical protein
MGYNEIDVVQMWRLRCQDCDFTVETRSAGMAEEIARGHIADETEGASNYSHTVEIQQITMVGRNV